MISLLVSSNLVLTSTKKPTRTLDGVVSLQLAIVVIKNVHIGCEVIAGKTSTGNCLGVCMNRAITFLRDLEDKQIILIDQVAHGIGNSSTFLDDNFRRLSICGGLG